MRYAEWRRKMAVVGAVVMSSVVAMIGGGIGEPPEVFAQQSDSSGFSYSAYGGASAHSPGVSSRAGSPASSEGTLGISFEVASEGPLPSEGPYTLGRGDVIRLLVRGQPEFSGDFVIGPDGKIQYSYLGDLPAAGKTKEQLKEYLTEQLSQYVRVPEVSITITGYHSKAVYILGGVAAPGKYFMSGDTIRLRDAIFGAGLPTRQASYRRVYVIKPSIEKPTYQVLNLYNVLYKGVLEDNIELKPGDLVVVPTTVLSETSFLLSTVLGPVFQAAVAADIASGEGGL